MNAISQRPQMRLTAILRLHYLGLTPLFDVFGWHACGVDEALAKESMR